MDLVVLKELSLAFENKWIADKGYYQRNGGKIHYDVSHRQSISPNLLSRNTNNNKC